jgi:hypothetical protein
MHQIQNSGLRKKPIGRTADFQKIAASVGTNRETVQPYT